MDDQHSEGAARRMVQAISTLHQQATSSTKRAAANAWLESFEQSAVAWQVCIELLQGTGQPYPALLYAAHTLRNKIRKQTQSLASGSLPALRDSLANGINRHSAELQPVSLQLCIAMSALVLQWTEWVDVLQYLGCRLTASNMLMLLEYLPQEPSDPVYGKILSGSSAYEWEAQSQYRVRPWSQEVITWLTQVKLEELAPSASQAQCRQLNCFAAWVRLGAIFEAETHHLDQLIGLAFQLTTSGNKDEFQAGSNTVLDVLEYSAEELHLRLMPLMPQIPQAAAQAATSRDMDRAERLCMVFTQFCDYNVSTLGSPSDLGNKLRNGLLQAALIPAYLDAEPTSGAPVAVGPLATCQYLAEHLQTPLKHNSGDMLGPQDTRAFFLQLLHGLLTNLQSTQQHEQEQVTESPLREACKDVLAAVCQLLGPEQFLQTVLQPVGGLTDHAASVEPKVLEAVLVAIVAAAEVISSSIEGAEGADGPQDETAAQRIANTILQLLLHLSSWSSSLGQCAARIQLVELEVMQTLAPALMHHLAATGGQAQDLMNFVLNKTGQLLQGHKADTVVSMSAARAIVQVCEVAETHNMPMPVSTLDGLLQLIQQATTCDVEQELAVALALCLSCIPIRPPASPNRQHYVSGLLQSLPTYLQQLAPQHSAQLSSDQAVSVSAAAASSSLQHARTLMMFMQSWRDTQHCHDQPHQSLNPAAEAFVSCWPLVEQALSSHATPVAVKDRIASCCTAAIRVHLSCSLPVLPGMLQAAAGAVATGSSSAHLWTAPLAAAIDQLEGQQLNHLSRPLLEALSIIDKSAPAQSLVDRAGGDTNPDFAISVLNLTITVARNAIKLQAGNGASSSLPLLDSGLYRAAACAACNHKDVASCSLTCMSSILEASSSSSFQSGEQMVYRAGQSIVQGLLTALLAVSALARVHKVCNIIVEMTGLSYPGGQTPDSCIAGWLHTSIQQLPSGLMETQEQVRFASECSTLVQSVVAERKQSIYAGSPGTANNKTLQSSTVFRHLKKCIRDFAECHQHDVV
ncbi:TPA: hypothetical protein ACH3X1_013041 [Trebouxia sp. C0004]